jgi:MFS family permease
MLAIQILAALVLYVPPVLAPVAQTEVGVAASSVGIVTALVFAAATLAALVSGRVIAHHGPLRVSQASLVLCGAGLALMASANPWLIAVGALVVGTGYGPVTPSSSVILAERAPARMRALIFSIKQTGVPIGGALAGVLLPALMMWIGWRGAGLTAAAACVVLAFALELVRPPSADRQTAADAAHSVREALALVIRHKPLRQLALASFTYSGMQNCLGSFLVVYLHETLGLSVAAAGFTLAVAMSAGIVGRIVWGALADHFVPARRLLALLGFGMSIAAFVTAAFTSAWPAGAVLAASLAFGATAVGWNGVYIAEVARIAPGGNISAATSASFAMTYAGVVALPLLFWLVVNATGSYAAAYAMAGCLTLWRGARLLTRVEEPIATSSRGPSRRAGSSDDVTVEARD